MSNPNIYKHSSVRHGRPNNADRRAVDVCEQIRDRMAVHGVQMSDAASKLGYGGTGQSFKTRVQKGTLTIADLIVIRDAIPGFRVDDLVAGGFEEKEYDHLDMEIPASPEKTTLRSDEHLTESAQVNSRFVPKAPDPVVELPLSDAGLTALAERFGL